MAGPWDALGAGIERGVAAYLQGQETQAQRKREEEEKARLEREWLLRKMQGESAMGQAAWERQFAEQKLAEARTAEERQRQADMEAAAREQGYKKELLQMELGARPGKEPEKALYDKQGFNGEVALFYALANQGLQSDSQLSQLLNTPQGQAVAENLVSRLVSTHRERWPGRNLEADFWAFFKARNPKLQSSADKAAAETVRQQNLAQQQAAREAQQAETKRLGAIPAQPQPGLLQSVSGAGRPAGVVVPSAGLPTALTQTISQQFSPDELAKLQMYDEAPDMTKQMMKSIEPFRSLLMRRGR
jgi:hypothetical protein